MDLIERKRMLLDTINHLEDLIMMKKFIEAYEGGLPSYAQEEEIDRLRKHLRLAHQSLKQLITEEVA